MHNRLVHRGLTKVATCILSCSSRATAMPISPACRRFCSNEKLEMGFALIATQFPNPGLCSWRAGFDHTCRTNQRSRTERPLLFRSANATCRLMLGIQGSTDLRNRPIGRRRKASGSEASAVRFALSCLSVVAVLARMCAPAGASS